MSKALLLLRLKRTDMDGDIIEQVIWKIPPSAFQPEGVRYRFAFIPHGERVPAVLYDNHHPKGHHKHVAGREQPIGFSGIEKLLEGFDHDVALCKKRRRGQE